MQRYEIITNRSIGRFDILSCENSQPECSFRSQLFARRISKRPPDSSTTSPVNRVMGFSCCIHLHNNDDDTHCASVRASAYCSATTRFYVIAEVMLCLTIRHGVGCPLS